ncbi:MAG: uroporphyrinogen decarboxylase family protein [Anaerolineae bacterium]
MEGMEVAWRTLNQESIAEPCIVGSWIMGGDYYSRVTGRDYWAAMEETYLEALVRLGINLCPQFVMPHDTLGNAGVIDEHWANRQGIKEPEEILPLIEQLPEDEELERDFDLMAEAARYAEPIRQHTTATRGQVLFLNDFGQADFMGPYNEWGYNPYLMAIALYPEHVRRYYHYTATVGRLRNLAIVEAVRRYDLAPFVYSGQDICANDGPLCSLEALDRLYWPELRRAIEPLLENDIRIIWHCDGNIMPILDRLIDLGVSGLQGFQEEAGVPFDQIVQVRSRWGRPMIVWGCVSVTTTLPFGTVEDVKAAVRRSYRLAGPGRGFGLASTSSIMPETPAENIDALYLYGREYGREYLTAGA